MGELLNDLKVLFSMGVSLFGVAGAWFAVKYGLAANTSRINLLSKKIDDLDKEMKDHDAEYRRTHGHHWAQIDDVSQKLAAQEVSVGRHEAVLDPNMMGDYREKRAKMEMNLKFLRRDVKKLMKRRK